MITQLAVNVWYCLYCGHDVEKGAECSLPRCVEERKRARKRMGFGR